MQLVRLKDLPFLHGMIPSKLVAIMPSGLPVICTAPGDSAELVRRADAGWTTPPSDPHSLAASCRLAYAAGSESLASKGERTRKRYLKNSARIVALTGMVEIVTQAVRE